MKMTSTYLFFKKSLLLSEIKHVMKHFPMSGPVNLIDFWKIIILIPNKADNIAKR